MPTDYAVELRGISKTYGGIIKANSDISFGIRRGRSCSLSATTVRENRH